MKAFVLAAGAAFLTATVPASASVVSLGGGFARACYVAAEAQNSSAITLRDCDLALAEQSLDARDIVATHVNRGILRMLGDNKIGAEADFRRAIELDPNEPEAWLNYGILRLNQKNSAAAIQMFERALALQTRRPELAYFGRALANEDRGNVRAAYVDLKRAQMLAPKWALPAEELSRYQVR